MPAQSVPEDDRCSTPTRLFDPRNYDQVAATLQTVTAAGKARPRTGYTLAVTDNATDQVIGFARLAVDTGHPGQSSAQLGFALAKATWGKGLGEETAMLLLRLGFDELDLHRLWGARSPANEVSGRLMTELGVIEEGRIRHHLRVRDRWIVHSILEDEWRRAPNRASTPGTA